MTRYQVLRQGRVLRIVDTRGCTDPAEGTAICFVGGDADLELVQDRARMVCDALNAVTS